MRSVNTIFYLEDCQSDVELLRRGFYESQVELKVFNTIRQAEEEFDIDRYLLAIVDLNLPDGGSLDFVRKIKKQDSQFPVIVLSGVLPLESEMALGQLQGVKSLEKDFELNYVQTIVDFVSEVKAGYQA